MLAVPQFMEGRALRNRFDDPHFTDEERKAQKALLTCYFKNPYRADESGFHSVSRPQSLPTRVPQAGNSTFRNLFQVREQQSQRVHPGLSGFKTQTFFPGALLILTMCSRYFRPF